MCTTPVWIWISPKFFLSFVSDFYWLMVIILHSSFKFELCATFLHIKCRWEQWTSPPGLLQPCHNRRQTAGWGGFAAVTIIISFEITCSFQSRSQHFLLLTLGKFFLKVFRLCSSRSDCTQMCWPSDIFKPVWKISMTSIRRCRSPPRQNRQHRFNLNPNSSQSLKR